MKYYKKKIVYYFCLLICFICFSFSFFFQLTYYHFNSQNVIENIRYLSSSEFKGRLTGTYENYKVSQYIKDIFEQCKLHPVNNNYIQSFPVTTITKNNTKCTMNFVNSTGKIVYKYSYGSDFKEDMLNCSTSSISINKNDSIDILSKSIVITHNNKKFLLYVPLKKDLNFRSSFNKNSEYEFCIAITTTVFNSILDNLRSGNILNINLPYSLYDSSTNNIVGVIKGNSSSLPPLIISAHFDHVGTDALGNIYTGALDNASGTSFMLELCKTLSKLPKPKRNIIFVGFSGEEFGLLGSKEFVKKNSTLIKNAKVINLDMIGVKDIPITLMRSNNSSSSQLTRDLEKYCNLNNVKYKIKYENSSDHASFTDKDMDAVTLCHADFSRIHTPNDTVDYIDSDSINQVYKVIQDEIYDYGYSRFTLFLYNINITLFFCIMIMTLIFSPIYKRRITKYLKSYNS